MSDDVIFDELMGRLRAGDNEAAAQVYNRYVPQLLNLVHRRLDKKVRATVDPDDVVQSVFRSFFVRNRQGQFDLANSDGLAGILAVIAMRKCSRRARYIRAGRRDIDKQIRIAPGGDDAGGGWELQGREASPPEQVVMSEIVERLMRGLDETEQPVLILSLKAMTVAQISVEIGRSERTVQRILDRLRRRLERMCSEEDDDPPVDP